MTKKWNKNSEMTLGRFVRALFEKGTPKYIKLMVGLALAYTIFPLDILPDILGPLGFADDAAVMAALTSIAMKLLDNYYDKQMQSTDNIMTAKMINN